MRWTWRELRGGGETAVIHYLEAQIDAARRGADVAQGAITGRLESEHARESMVGIEHEGDSARATLVDHLYRSFMTPVDREDLYRLSRSIDDVLDNLRDFVREVDLMQVQDQQDFPEVLGAIRVGLEELQEAVRALGSETYDLRAKTLRAKKASSDVRRIYQAAVARLFEQEDVSMAVLRRRELLRRLDGVGLRLGEAADALSDGAVKRSH